MEVIENFKKDHPEIIQSSNIIALLPGSRRQEISAKLPIMLEASKNFPGYTFIVAKAPSVEDEFYEPFLSGYNNVKVVANETYSLLMKAKAH